MAYCTTDDMLLAMDEATLVQLLDDEKLSTDPSSLAQTIADNPKVQSRLDWVLATPDVDMAIRGRYSVPLTTVPEGIRHIAVCLAVHAAFARRAHVFGEVPKSIQRRYDEARKDLGAIRDNTKDLGVEPPPAASSAIVADTDGPERQFTSTTMREF